MNVKGQNVVVFVNKNRKIVGKVSSLDGRKVLIKTKNGDEHWVDYRKLRTCRE